MRIFLELRLNQQKEYRQDFLDLQRYLNHLQRCLLNKSIVLKIKKYHHHSVQIILHNRIKLEESIIIIVENLFFYFRSISLISFQMMTTMKTKMTVTMMIMKMGLMMMMMIKKEARSQMVEIIPIEK